MRVLFALTMLLLVAGPAGAVERFVTTTGSDSNDGTSIGTAWATIQKCADTLTSGGDICTVKAGTYFQRVNINTNSGSSGNPIIFRGERDGSGNWLTIVDGSTAAPASWVAAPEVGAGV